MTLAFHNSPFRCEIPAIAVFLIQLLKYILAFCVGPGETEGKIRGGSAEFREPVCETQDELTIHSLEENCTICETIYSQTCVSGHLY